MHRPCCLILEDQALVAMALEASLDEAGFAVAGPFSNAVDALKCLCERTPDLALVDVLLRDGTCLPVARELRRQNVPYAIYSGLQRPQTMPPEFEDVPWLGKPISRAELSATLLGLAREASLPDMARGPEAAAD